jgi:pimeloyl-ACP methyl ester carboxylesterase
VEGDLSWSEASAVWAAEKGTRRLEGRLTPEAMYPAGASAIRTRFLQTPSCAVVRVIESGPPDGAPVVCVHGWGASVYTFRSTVPTLTALGKRCIAIDLKGHGLSTKPIGAGEYTREAMSLQIREVLDALGISRASLIGHSMGSAVAFDLALADPERFDRVVLMSPIGFGKVNVSQFAALLPPPLADPVLPYVVPRAVLQVTLKFIMGRRRQGAITDDEIDQYWAPTQFPTFTMALLRLGREFDWSPADAARLARCTTPALILVGTEDRLVDFTIVEEQVARLPRGRLSRVLGSGHVVPEEGGAQVAELLGAFLSPAGATAA